jgi:hypothetical protein
MRWQLYRDEIRGAAQRRDGGSSAFVRRGERERMSEVVVGLGRLSAMLARRRSAAALLGGAAAAVALLALAALAAGAGAFRHFGWGPLAAWVGAGVCAGMAMRPSWTAWRRPVRAALRDAAALVERELALRRGAFVGIVDAALGAPPLTSPALLASAERRLTLALPPGASAWAPATARVLARRIRGRAAALVVVALGAVLAFSFAGDAAADLGSPLRALKASLGARIEIAVAPREVRRGAAAVVNVRSTSPEALQLFVREPGETWHSFPLARAGPGRATARFPAIEAPLFVYATAGRAASDTLRIGVVEPPFVSEFTVTARFPSYLERDDEVLPPDSGPVALPVGTVLRIRGAASQSVSSAALVAGGGGGAARVALAASGRSFAGELVVRGSAAWRLALADPAGAPFPGPLPLLDVRAVPDSAPVVTVPVPGADTTAPLDLELPLVVDARDDHALGRVEIVSWRVSRLGNAGERLVDTLAGVSGADRTVQSTLLDLNGRGLLPGDTLRFFARAFDRAPQPHVGSSREYAIRLRSLSELREAVRAATDSLSRRASHLAGDEAALGRRTEDLAAQRNRGADSARAPAPAPESPAADQAARSAPLPFEQAQEAGRVREEQQRLLDRAQALRQELSRVAQAAEQAGLNDPAWQQRLRELDQLLQQAITPELAARLEELRQALQRLDPRAVEQALRRLAEMQQELRRELERSAELFERAALEGSMQTFAQNADALRQAEQQWAAQAPARRDTAVAAQEQLGLRREADTLRAGMEGLGPRLVQRGDSTSAATVAQAAQQVQQAAGKMADAAAAMSAAERRQAQQRAEAAAEALRPVADSLRQRQGSMSAAWRAEVLKLLHDALAETITLAVEEQGMSDRLKRGEGSGDVSGRQSSMEQGVDQIARRLGEASGRNALVSPRLGAALGQARGQIEQSRRAVEGPRADPGEAAGRAQDAAQALSSAAFQIMRAEDAVSGAESGSGFAEALKRLAEMAGRQGALNDQLGGLLPLMGPGALADAALQQLREIAARQRGLANELERLGGMGLPGRPEELAQEARRLADRLEQGQLDRQTLERQQRLFRRMLDAGRTLRNDQEDEPQRRSETAREREAHAPAGSVPREAALQYPIPRWDQLKGLSATERAMVLDYFRRINARDR